MPLEDLPEGTGFTDVLAAAQAAWLAGDYPLARDLIQRYIDPSGEFCCMRCTSTRDEPWSLRINGRAAFYVCHPCSQVVLEDPGLMQLGDEVSLIGPTYVGRMVAQQAGAVTRMIVTRQSVKFKLMT